MMWEFSRFHYEGLLASLDSGTGEEKGRALEDIMEYLFGLLPGLEVNARDVRTDAEELDLILWNGRSHPVLQPWSSIIFVECKNWSTAVGSRDIGWFVNELRRRSLQNGIFIARKGISGDQYSEAGRVVFEALRERIQVVVLTGNELEQVRGKESLADLLKTKYCRLFVGKFV